MEAPRDAGLLTRVVRFARLAESFARRTSGTFLLVALAGLAGALWLAVFMRQILALPAWLSFPVSLLLVTPSIVLFRLQRILHGAIGLPERLVRRATGLREGAGALRAALGERESEREGEVRLRQLVGAGKALRTLRGAGGEIRELVTTFGSAAALWNPLFPLLLAATTALNVLLTLLGLVALAWVTFG